MHPPQTTFFPFLHNPVQIYMMGGENLDEKIKNQKSKVVHKRKGGFGGKGKRKRNIWEVRVVIAIRKKEKGGDSTGFFF